MKLLEDLIIENSQGIIYLKSGTIIEAVHNLDNVITDPKDEVLEMIQMFKESDPELGSNQVVKNIFSMIIDAVNASNIQKLKHIVSKVNQAEEKNYKLTNLAALIRRIAATFIN
jgi:hypothetical protein